MNKPTVQIENFAVWHVRTYGCRFPGPLGEYALYTMDRMSESVPRYLEEQFAKLLAVLPQSDKDPTQ